MNMLLTTIVLFIAFGIFAVGISRLLVKMFPPSAEDIERSKNRKRSMFDDDDWDDWRSDNSPGVNIGNDIDHGIWGR